MQLCTAVVVFMGFHYWTNNRVYYLRNPKNLSKNKNRIFYRLVFLLSQNKNIQYTQECKNRNCGVGIVLFRVGEIRHAPNLGTDRETRVRSFPVPKCKAQPLIYFGRLQACIGSRKDRKRDSRESSKRREFRVRSFLDPMHACNRPK